MVFTRQLLAGTLLMLALVSCGGGDDEETAPTTASLGATTTTTEPSFSAGAGSQEFCDQSQQAEQRLGQLSQAGATPEAAREVFVSAAQTLRSLAGSAPAEIKGDVELIANAYDDLVKSLEGAGWDPTRMGPEITGKLTQPDVTAAGQRLQAYQRQVCGASGP